MTALIDADVLCYRAAGVSVSKFKWDDEPEPVPYENPKTAMKVADEIIADWTKRAGEKQRLLVFSDRTVERTFRYDICPTYKGNRPEEKPPLHDFVHDYLMEKYTGVTLPELEGDDTMALMATGEGGSKYVIVSIDKDMLTVPAHQFNPDKDEKPHKQSLKAADYNWLFQTITGDSVDCYAGAPGAGPKRAAEELAGCTTFDQQWSAVLRVYEDQFNKPRWRAKFLTDDPHAEALMNARCARILRFGDWDPKNGVKLWTPN